MDKERLRQAAEDEIFEANEALRAANTALTPEDKDKHLDVYHAHRKNAERAARQYRDLCKEEQPTKAKTVRKVFPRKTHDNTQ